MFWGEYRNKISMNVNSRTTQSSDHSISQVVLYWLGFSDDNLHFFFTVMLASQNAWRRVVSVDIVGIIPAWVKPSHITVRRKEFCRS